MLPNASRRSTSRTSRQRSPVRPACKDAVSPGAARPHTPPAHPTPPNPPHTTPHAPKRPFGIAGCEIITSIREEHRTTSGYGIQALIDTRVTKASVKDLQQLGIVAKVPIQILHSGRQLAPGLLGWGLEIVSVFGRRAARSCSGRAWTTPLLSRRTRRFSPSSRAPSECLPLEGTGHAALDRPRLAYALCF